MHADGHVYMKYKNSDIGPRVWKNIVAAPVWIPPDGTPAKDLLTRKVLDRNVGPVTVVNTDVMGPGYQSAYGLVMGDPHRSQARRLRQPDPHARVGRLHVDRAPLLARLPPPGEQPRRAPVRLRAAPPRASAASATCR